MKKSCSQLTEVARSVGDLDGVLAEPEKACSTIGTVTSRVSGTGELQTLDDVGQLGDDGEL